MIVSPASGSGPDPVPGHPFSLPPPLRLGRDLCAHLALAERREWLVTNGIGGYGCGTVAGVLTRSYHGLLVAALKPPLDRTLLLAQLEERVQLDDRITPLCTHRWADGRIEPRGYVQIESFHLEGSVPTWAYAVAEAILEKRIWMEQGSNITYVRYTLLRATRPLRLRIRALVNHRSHHATSRSGEWRMAVTPLQPTGQPDTAFPGPCGVRVLAHEGATPLHLLADGGRCTPCHDWLRGFSLSAEQARGLPDRDDHLSCARFTVDLRAGQSFTLTASAEAAAFPDANGALARRRARDRECLECWRAGEADPDPSPGWILQLALAADQFIVRRGAEGRPQGLSVIAGYPWFGDWGRDTMIALPGLAIATGRPEVAATILRGFAGWLDRGMLPNVFPEQGTAPHYNTADASLWFVEAVRHTVAASDDLALLEDLFTALEEIIHWYGAGTRFGIRQQADGLLQCGEAGVQVTWMDAKVGDRVITPRIGKPIEINALWYNALRSMAWFAKRLGRDGDSYAAMAAQTRGGMERFWCESLGHCFDVLDGPAGNDPSLRPNQILAVSLPAIDFGAEALFTPRQRRRIVETVARELLTSCGLRSLAPGDGAYRGTYGGDPAERDSHYHQGPVWGWLLGPFTAAHLRVYGDRAAALRLLAPMEDQLRSGCVGSLAEIFDGDPPHDPRGAFAQAWSVAEVLRVWRLLHTLGRPGGPA